MEKKESKTIKNKNEVKNLKKKKKSEKVNLMTKLHNFFHGVKSEAKRVKWPTKKDMVKYSIATIVFIIACSLFFYVIDIVMALLRTLGK